MTSMMRRMFVLHSQTFGILNIQINLNRPGVDCMHLDCDKNKSVVYVRRAYKFLSLFLFMYYYIE